LEQIIEMNYDLILKMTSFPAQTLGIFDRGLIRKELNHPVAFQKETHHD